MMVQNHPIDSMHFRYLAKLFPKRVNEWDEFLDLVRDENSKSITAGYTIRSHLSGVSLVSLESVISIGYSTHIVFSLTSGGRRMVFEEVSQVFSSYNLNPPVERQKNLDSLVQFDKKVQQVSDQVQRDGLTVVFLGQEYKLDDYKLMMAEQIRMS